MVGGCLSWVDVGYGMFCCLTRVVVLYFGAGYMCYVGSVL